MRLLVSANIRRWRKRESRPSVSHHGWIGSKHVTTRGTTNKFSHLLAISPFNDGLEMLLLHRDEPRHVVLQQEGGRPFEFQDVAHQRAAVTRMKFVDVPQSPEKSAHYLIDEASRPIDFGDPRREPLPNSEVPALECQQVAELQHARGPSRLDDALA